MKIADKKIVTNIFNLLVLILVSFVIPQIIKANYGKSIYNSYNFIFIIVGTILFLFFAYKINFSKSFKFSKNIRRGFKYLFFILLTILLILFMPFEQFYFESGTVCTTGIPAACNDYDAKVDYKVLILKAVVSFAISFVIFFVISKMKKKKEV